MQTVIHTPTGNIDKSRDFYTKLGYKLVSEEPLRFSDGKVLVEINPDRHARAGLKIYTDQASALVSKLGDVCEVLELSNGFLSCDPNGVRLYVTEEPLGIDFEPADASFGLTGNYAGISIETHDFPGTAKFWKAAGFDNEEGDISQGWCGYSNGSPTGVSVMKPLMCPHLFFNPGMTFFNGGKNLTNIGLLREAGIDFTEEITAFSSDGVADNVIIRDPGGYGFFVFND